MSAERAVGKSLAESVLVLVIGTLLTQSAFSAISIVTNDAAVTVSGSGTLDAAFDAPDVTTVTYNPSGGLVVSSQTPSSYIGGTTVNGNVGNGDILQLSCCKGAFGAGDITLNGSAGLYSYNADVVLTNRVNVTGSSLVGSFGGSLTLRSVGLADDTYPLRIGRVVRTYASKTVLSLDESSDAMRAISLFGPASLTIDGGVIKMCEASRTPFININNDSATASASLTVTTNGCTFAVPAGIRTSLGLPVAIQAHRDIQVEETRQVQNYDFESGSTGWGLVIGSGTQKGYVCANGSAFDGTDYGTPSGTHYMMMRCGNIMTQIVDNVSDGLWRLRFLCGCRKGGSYSPQPVYVSIDGTTVFQMQASSQFPFSEFVTDAVELSGDASHVIEFSIGGTYSVGSMNIDRVVMERVTYHYPRTVVGKTGGGELTFDGEHFVHTALSVSDGTLALVSCSLSNVVASSSTGGRLVLADNVLDADTYVSVAPNGVLALSDAGTNLVKNASFEDNVDGWYSASPNGWTVTSGGGGAQRNGGDITPSGPYTPFGKETACIRPGATMSQTVTIPESGTYRLSFAYAARAGYSVKNMTLVAKIGDSVVTNMPASLASSSEFRSSSNTIALAAGTNVLSFEVAGTGTTGAMLLVDDVQLHLVKKPADIMTGEIHMMRGSALELDYDGIVNVDALFVDGVRINGGRAALKNAGVNVSGRGLIRVGEPVGLIIKVY